MTIDFTVQANYLKVEWTPEKETDERANIAFYPITTSCFTVNFGMVIDPKGGTSLWTAISISLFNSLMNTTTEITADEIAAGIIQIDGGKIPVSTIYDMTSYLSRNTGYPINNTADADEPVLDIPIAKPRV
jgi:hypothetical protein